VHEVGAHESNEFEEAVGFFGDLLQGAQKKKGDQGDGDLDAHGVFRPADEPSDVERLFHQSEDQLDPPAALVQIRDLLSGASRSLVKRRSVWPVSFLTTISRYPRPASGFLRFMACRAGRKPMRSPSTVDPGFKGHFARLVQPRIGPEARHQPAAQGVELRPEAEVVIAEIENRSRPPYAQASLSRAGQPWHKPGHDASSPFGLPQYSEFPGWQQPAPGGLFLLRKNRNRAMHLCSPD
jgi:hypothetical protein